jgi:serine/threonine protein kinase
MPTQSKTAGSSDWPFPTTDIDILETDLTKSIPSEYVVVQPIGAGSTAEVFLCLPKDVVDWAKKCVTDRQPINIENLTIQLVAIKVLKPQFTQLTEVKCLGLIQEYSKNCEIGKYCQQLLSYGPDERWMALTPAPGSLQLEDVVISFMEAKTKIPEEFVWHVFIQLTQAMFFLHHVCRPSIVHCDLHMGNILLDVSEQDCHGFPNIRVIDFGMAEETDREVALAEDRQMLYTTLSDLNKVFGEVLGMCKCELTKHFPYRDTSSMPDCVHTEGWIEFQEMLYEGITSMFGHLGDDRSTFGLVEMWGRFGDIALRNREATSDETMLSIKSHTFNVVANRVREVERRIASLLE